MAERGTCPPNSCKSAVFYSGNVSGHIDFNMHGANAQRKLIFAL